MRSIKSEILKEMYQILGTYDLLKLNQGALKKLNNVPKSNIILAITKIFRTKTCSELYGLTEEFFLFFKEELKPMLLYLCYKAKTKKKHFQSVLWIQNYSNNSTRHRYKNYKNINNHIYQMNDLNNKSHKLFQ